MTVNSSTISNNRAVDVGGVDNRMMYQQFVFRNTLIAQNTGNIPDCRGWYLLSVGYNLIGNTTSCNIPAATGDIFNKNPKLGKLINGLGYIPLQPGSPAIDAGHPSGCKGNPGVLTTDQRGMPRVGRCDIGAYEYALPGQVSALAITEGDNQTAPPFFAYPKAFQVAVLDNYGTPIPNVTVSFTAPASGPGGIFSNTGINSAASISNGDGLATAPAFIANDQFGAFIVTASIEGVASIDFNAANSVWYVSTTGNDTNSCLAPDAPCATINGGINKAGSGDSIFVAAGTYTNSGNEVALIAKDINLYGGWSADFTMNNEKTIIDGQSARRGFTVQSFLTAKIDNFFIQNGFSNSGNGVYNGRSNLTLQKITVDHGTGSAIVNGKGISSISNSTISHNTGEGVINTGQMIIKNSTVSGNISEYNGGGIYNASSGILTIKNSTITNNSSNYFLSSGGIFNESGTVTIQNTILAGNSIPNGGAPDCLDVTSAGYNLIGSNKGCNITSMPGDQIGTSITPIDPQLAALQDNGGSTFTHGLLGTSPAINKGSPTTCLPTDQRGVTRPISIACDIGAFELNYPVVLSSSPNPKSGPSTPVIFTIKFSEAVTGLDKISPFDDFNLIATNLTGSAITSVSGTGDTYYVTVAPGTSTTSSNGTVNLELVDHDTIENLGGVPLGNTGNGNGDFSSSEPYTVIRVPVPLTPKQTVPDNTPTFRWAMVPGSSAYQYQVLKGGSVIETRKVSSSKCNSTTCSSTPANSLEIGKYTWRVRALVNSAWMDFSPDTAFTVSPAKFGYWAGGGLDFYITTKAKVSSFTIYITINGCGNYKITYTPLVNITNNAFSFGGPFYANGKFITVSQSQGILGLNSLLIANCGYLSAGPFTWTGSWVNKNQPPALLINRELLPAIITVPTMESFDNSFVIEKVEP